MINKKNWGLLILAIILAMATGITAAKNREPIGHQCSYDLCPFIGQETFNGSVCGCEYGTDCSLLDIIHFDHPEWDYDQCEAYLFTTDIEKNQTKY